MNGRKEENENIYVIYCCDAPPYGHSKEARPPVTVKVKASNENEARLKAKKLIQRDKYIIREIIPMEIYKMNSESGKNE
jgi:hypothetical protein